MINIILVVLVAFVMIYPLYFIIIASVSEPRDVLSGRVVFLPVGFTLEAYQNVLRESRIWIGYRNTLLYTTLGTLLALFMTMPAAYVLSKKNLVGRGLLSWFFIIPMYFGGGLIPTYLQVKSLSLLDKPYTLAILGSLSIYNVIVTRVYFQTAIPEEIFESAHIDGAGEIRTFLQIALPLAKPIIAVMALFYAVGRWNDFFTALIYVSKADYQPLQLVLRGILLLNQRAMDGINMIKDTEMIKDLSRLAYLAEAMKYSIIFIASAPLLVAYPFVQKHFIKGLMVGSLKG